MSMNSQPLAAKRRSTQFRSKTKTGRRRGGGIWCRDDSVDWKWCRLVRQSRCGGRDRPRPSLDPGLAFAAALTPPLPRSRTVGRRRILSRRPCWMSVPAPAFSASRPWRFGAESVTAVDHDPQALLATRHNASENGVSRHLSSSPDLASTPGRFDVILANIVSGALFDMAPALAARLAPTGQMLPLRHPAASGGGGSGRIPRTRRVRAPNGAPTAGLHSSAAQPAVTPPVSA